MKFYLIKSCIQRSHIVETESFSETFGPRAQRKKPRLDVGSFEELSQVSAAAVEQAEEIAEAQHENPEGRQSDV